MLYSSIKKGSFNYSQLKNSSILLILSLTTFLIRFPFFFRDYIDRDESTFILLGQSWVDGHLPYIELWDLKPPLTFAFFAAIIAVFGKSFIAIRFFGSLLVIITAFYTYKTSLRISTRKTSFCAAIGCVVLLSLFGSLQGVMSEHICMAFFIPALYLLLTKRQNYWFFVSGILMGVVVMVKLNMAYPVLILELFLCYELFRTKQLTSLWKIVFFSTGILLVILLTILPYYQIGEFRVWWNSVILAPLEYTGARRYSIFKLSPIFILIGTFLFFSWKKQLLEFKDRTVLILILSIAGVLFSFLKGGRINGHYLIQLHPMLIILFATAMHQLITSYRIKIHRVFFFLLLLVPAESYLEYGNIISNKIKRGTFFNGEGFSVPVYISQNKIETKNILFFGYHIGYWNLSSLPPTKAATHPSSICRDELFTFFDNPRKTSIEELRYIMEELRPKTIVVRKGRRVFDKKEIEENEYIDAYLLKHYKVYATIEKADILQRL